jgi:hypothetical protein
MPVSVMPVQRTVTEFNGALVHAGAVAATVKVQLETPNEARLTAQPAVEVVVTAFMGALEGKERVLGLNENDDTLPTQGAMFKRPNGTPMKAGTATSIVATTPMGARADITNYVSSGTDGERCCG